MRDRYDTDRCSSQNEVKNDKKERDLDALVREGKRIRTGGATPGNLRAFELFRQAANGGHAEAQFLISKYYRFELGVKLERAEYLYWLRKSAESGFAPAQNALGFEVRADDKVQAIEWFQKAAEQNNTKAMLNLGGLAEDAGEYAKAVSWYRKAAELGNSYAQFLLGEFHSKGQGVVQDHHKAAAWWRTAAEKGEKRAQYKLGTCYALGVGVPLNKKEAVGWWAKAAENGWRDAFYDLGICYARGKGVPENKPAAYIWLRLAAAECSKTISAKAKAEAVTLEKSLSSSEIQACLKFCKEFDDRERSREPPWWREIFKAVDLPRTWQPLNETTT